MVLPLNEPPQPAPEFEARLAFDGRGSEYFRIWVVNTLLSLLTLGIYSAWAKVRKARWFAQHTALMGDRFDYHGQPWRILLGRVLAIGLLVLWSLGFDWSLALGLGVLLLFCLLGPILFASAQRFKLANSSWRGLRFGFDVPRAEVYRVCVPLLLIWTSGSVLAALGVEGGALIAAGLVFVLAMPWAHARLKQLQHSHARFGDQGFSFEPAATPFYGLYAKGLVLLIVGGMLAALMAGLVASIVGGGTRQAMGVSTIVMTLMIVLVIWLLTWPYFAARQQQIVWSHTHWGGVRFRGEMRGGTLWLLVLKQTVLVLLTAGLYWPFAAVALARYRVTSLVVEADSPIAEISARAAVEQPRAAGDAAADMFGLDLGW